MLSNDVDDIGASIETLEAGRWDSLWFADHFLPPSPGVPGRAREQEQGTALEGYTLIAVAAGMTDKLRLGHLVLGNTFRNPALLAKMATTLDQASKGRFVLSLGAAWSTLDVSSPGPRQPISAPYRATRTSNAP